MWNRGNSTEPETSDNVNTAVQSHARALTPVDANMQIGYSFTGVGAAGVSNPRIIKVRERACKQTLGLRRTKTQVEAGSDNTQVNKRTEDTGKGKR